MARIGSGQEPRAFHANKGAFGRPLPRSLTGAALGLMAGAFLMFTGVADSLERPLADLRARIFAAPGRESGRIGLIYIDQRSLDWAEDSLGLAWPWPRETYGAIADFCRKADALVFDVLFTEGSPYGKADDERFAAALARHGRVALALAGDARSVIDAPGMVFGSARALPDPDGVVRRYRDTYRDAGGGAVDSLGLAAARTAGLATPPGVDAPQAAEQTRHLRFRGKSPSYRAWNAAEILRAAIEPAADPAAMPIAGQSATATAGQTLKPEDFSGMIIFLGMSAPGLLDRVPTPVDPAMPGAEIHATFTDNLLSGDFLVVPGSLTMLAISALLALAAAFSLLPAGRPLAQTAGVLISLAAAPAAAFAAYRFGILLPIVTPLASAGFSTLGALALAYASEGRQRAYLRGAFGQYLSHEVIESLLKDPGSLRLGGERRRISVLFTDVQDFTRLSESMDPGRLTSFMNEYLGIVTEAILREGGTVDKYVGDAVVAFWNAPLAQEDHASRAISAAVSIQEGLAQAGERLAAISGKASLTRIGVHTGDAAVGNMGSRFRFNYTALGDAVNLASRLESANKALGTRILCSGETIEAAATPTSPARPATLSAASARRLGLLRVVGREAPCEVWEIWKPSAEPWEGVRTLESK